MTETVKISSDNQITLSAKALDLLGVKAGDQVEIVPGAGGHLEIRPRRRTFADLRGIVNIGRPITSEEIDEWVAEARGRIPGNDRDP